MKAILVIDMPNMCSNCCLSNSGISPNDDWNCSVVLTAKNGYMCRKKIKLEDIDSIQSWCPLKPIPNEACQILVEGLEAMEKMKSIEVRVVRRTG